MAMGKEDKTFFDKKIVYLDYLESGEKIKNGGFVKWDVRGEDCRIQIHIRGLYTTDTLQGEIKLISREETYGADRIGLQYGTGEYATHWKNSDLAGTGLSYAECDGILIRLSDTRVLKGQWRERTREAELLPQESTEPVPAQKEDMTPMSHVVEFPMIKSAEMEEPETTVQGNSQVAETMDATELEIIEEVNPPEAEISENSEAMETAETTEPEQSESVAGESSQTADALQSEQVREEIAQGRESEPKEESEEQESREEQPMASNFPLSQDKWEQLEKLYPRIHPFGDNREYLSITPRDFIVLARQYQELVQNSFLLHGYYNYGHLILTKIMEKDEERYYLGVPGVYFDREKQAALMFGFEGFEAGTDKMEEGGFGYYMKRVEI